MTCEEFKLQLTAFSLGELEPGERQRARDHLAGCDDCASRVLMDRQLTALLRTSAVPVPEATRTAVLAAVRAEASPSAPVPEPAGRPAPSPRRPARRRHWVALAAALVGAAAVVAAALLVVPAPDPGSPLSAAWSSYHHRGEDGLGAPSQAEADRLFAVLGPASRTPDLTTYGLRKAGWEERDLAGHVAAVAEYRDAEGGRVTLMRWRGDLPRMAKGAEGGELAAYRWGRHISYWWQADGVVWCLVGTIDQERLYKIAEGLGGESSAAGQG
ncbi:MAG TPA: zf-HC2 domain-containing protein [Actinomycetota bacterium]|jgi:anti-sigma factor RsiW|nr:zf-HC2 domain-containing protein [Actinomycetes bacterium]HEX5878742.1 zf-HC2 domain-containing protein [Actinomycetota bacterium]